MTEPLPCPFCGHHPDVDDGEFSFFIECINPECAIRPSHMEEPIKDGDTGCEDRAIAAWNTRAPVGDDVVERVARAIYASLTRLYAYTTTWDELGAGGQSQYVNEARAAIAAMRAG